MPRLSVIIPVKNGAATLERCLQTIVDQTIAGDLEIIILNSMSTDGSVEIASRFNARIIDIPAGTFNHGLTRNTGVLHATGSFVYLTVQDAWISKNDMMEKMLRHFDSKDIVAVGGHQAVPHELDKNPLFWYRPISSQQVTVRASASREAFEKLSDDEQKSLVSWDNVVAMYRKGALIDQAFIKTEFSEDWVWSYNALLRGWKMVYDSSLVVYHYHHQSYQYVFNTGYIINYHFYKFFNYKPIVPALIRQMAQATYHLLKNKILSPKEKLYWILHNLSGRVSNYISTVNFLIRLKTGGEKGIEKGYRKYCNSIPQGQQKH